MIDDITDLYQCRFTEALGLKETEKDQNEIVLDKLKTKVQARISALQVRLFERTQLGEKLAKALSASLFIVRLTSNPKLFLTNLHYTSDITLQRVTIDMAYLR